MNVIFSKISATAYLLLFCLTTAAVAAQTNLEVAVKIVAGPTNEPGTNLPAGTETGLESAQRAEALRAVCIQNRRIICGKIIKIFPDGIVVDSGYTNLLRAPLNQSWLIPGTAVATRADHEIEARQPDAICMGLVFLTDLPKSRNAKPKVFDYVALEGFPMGSYTYTSVGEVKRTVRRFTTKIANAVRWNFEENADASAGKP